MDGLQSGQEAAVPEAVELARSSASVRERDLDNFLLEELQASVSFRAWFLERLAHCFEAPDGARAVVGKNPRREVEVGQTDLSLAFVDALEETHAIVLIEDKVADGFQPGQPERYASERAAAVNRLGARRAAAVVVAPSANRRVLYHPAFDASVTLEEIIIHLRGRADELSRAVDPASSELRERLLVRIGLLDALAGKRAYGTWTPNPVPERVGFMEQYRALAVELAPHLKTTDSSSGKQSTTILFSGVSVPGIAVSGIRHDFGRSQRVSLVVRRAARAKHAIEASGLLPRGAVLEATGSGSLMICMRTPPIVPQAERFDAQRELVAAAIKQALALEAWARENAPALTGLVKRAEFRARFGVVSPH